MSERNAATGAARVKVEANQVRIDAVKVTRAEDDETGVLRRFSAKVIATGSEADRDVTIGSIEGLYALCAESFDLQESGDCMGDAEEMLCAAADEIGGKLPMEPRHVVMVELLKLDPRWRGNRLAGRIVDQFLGVLGFDSTETLVVLQPEPLDAKGKQRDPGPERDAAMKALCAAYRASGFKPLRKGPVWYRRPVPLALSKVGRS